MEGGFDTDVDDLWSALTDPRRLAHWYGEVEGDLRVGGEFHARHADGERIGRVKACDAPRSFVVTLRDPDPKPGQPEEIVIEAGLTAKTGRTMLVVEARGLPLHLLAAYGTGVQIHVEHLADHMAGHESRDTEARWEELHPHYEGLAADVS
jgi:uncharacterized protein YndB with AHSA1/START domain